MDKVIWAEGTYPESAARCLKECIDIYDHHASLKISSFKSDIYACLYMGEKNTCSVSFLPSV